MNKLLRIFSQLIMILLISGCSFYVETSKVRGMYDDTQNDVSEKIEEIKEDYDQRNNMIQSITSQIPNSEITPYPELNDKLDEMDKSIDDPPPITNMDDTLPKISIDGGIYFYLFPLYFYSFSFRINFSKKCT